MSDPKTVSRWKIGLWIGMAGLLLGMVAYGLIEGEVVIGRHHDHYLRSREPGGYWFGIAFYATLTGILIYSLLKAKPHPRTPRQPPDLTPRDWMGNPLDRK